MSLLWESSVEASLIVVAALVATVLLRTRAASLRHGVLAAALLAALVAPVLGSIAPAWSVPMPWSAPVDSEGLRLVDAAGPTAGLPVTPGGLSAHPSDARAVTLVELLAILWAMGTAFYVVVLLVGIAGLARLARRATPVRNGTWTQSAREICREYGIHRAVVLEHSDDPTLLVTWGTRRPRIIVPPEAAHWPEDRVRAVLRHELAHVRRADWAVQLGAEFVRAVHWFNPLVWIACRRLREESEYACDEAVLDAGVDGREYATHLLHVARSFRGQQRTWLPAPAVVRPSTLQRRIRVMLNADCNRTPATRWASAVAVAAMFCIAVPIAGFGPAAPAAAIPVVAVTSTEARTVVERPDQAPSPAVHSPFAGTAALWGVVRDPQRLPLPGASVTLTSEAGTTVDVQETTRTGSFEFPNVAAGSYVLTVSLPGFTTAAAAVTLAANATVEQNVPLEIGSLEETITVTGVAGRVLDVSARPAAAQDDAEVERRRQKFSSQPKGNGCPADIGGCIRVPVKIRDVRPIYPAGAQAAGIEGLVGMSATIGSDGRVKRVEVLEPAEIDLAAAAAEAVKGWEFTPTLLNGKPVEVHMRVSVWFSLQR